jgi:diacylglycerol kinase family enzyme
MTGTTALIINHRAAKIRRIKDQMALELFLKRYFWGIDDVNYYVAMDKVPLDSHKNFIVCGGDGTVHVTLQALATLEDKLLGYVPLGTGDDFSKALNIHDIETSAHCIRKALAGDPQYVKKLDLGVATIHNGEKESKEYFVGACGMGIDGSVPKRLESDLGWVKKTASYLKTEKLELLQNFGKAVYNIGVLMTLLGYKPGSLLIRVNDSIEKRIVGNAFSLNVSNIRTTGGGIEVCPNAEPDDGYLDMCIISNISKLYGIGLLGKANSGQHIGSRGESGVYDLVRGVEYHDAASKIRKVEVESLDYSPFNLHFSGECRRATKVVLEIIPKRLNVIFNPNAA